MTANKIGVANGINQSGEGGAEPREAIGAATDPTNLKESLKGTAEGLGGGLGGALESLTGGGSETTGTTTTETTKKKKKKKKKKSLEEQAVDSLQKLFGN